MYLVIAVEEALMLGKCACSPLFTRVICLYVLQFDELSIFCSMAPQKIFCWS